MTTTDYIIFNSTARKIEYYQENNFDKYVILDYIDGIINQVSKCDLCSNELTKHLFDFKQKVLLGKRVWIMNKHVYLEEVTNKFKDLLEEDFKNNKITEDEYMRMQKNVQALSEKLSSGQMLRCALSEVVSYTKNLV